MARLRACVVGVGYVGRYHAQKYRDMPEVDLVAVVDLRYDRALSVARELQTEAYRSLQELVHRVDIASVAVPTTSHCAVATELMDQGVHVLVEKPMASSLEEAEAMADRARSRGVVLQVGHLERFNPAIRAILPHLENPLFLECHRISPYQGRGTDVDVVLDLMIHDIDLLLYFLKAEPIQVDAVGVPVLTPQYDIVNARFRFPSGCVANVTASRVSAKSLRKIRIFQPNAYFSVDCGKGEARIYRRVRSGGSDKAQITAESLCVGEGDSLLEEIRSFVEAVRFGRPPVVDGAAGIRSLKVALKVLEDLEETCPKGLLETLAREKGHG